MKNFIKSRLSYAVSERLNEIQYQCLCSPEEKKTIEYAVSNLCAKFLDLKIIVFLEILRIFSTGEEKRLIEIAIAKSLKK